MQANPANTWGQLKEQLAVRFSDVTDPQMALSMLRSVKQKRAKTFRYTPKGSYHWRKLPLVMEVTPWKDN